MTNPDVKIQKFFLILSRTKFSTKRYLKLFEGAKYLVNVKQVVSGGCFEGVWKVSRGSPECI